MDALHLAQVRIAKLAALLAPGHCAGIQTRPRLDDLARIKPTDIHDGAWRYGRALLHIPAHHLSGALLREAEAVA